MNNQVNQLQSRVQTTLNLLIQRDTNNAAGNAQRLDESLSFIVSESAIFGVTARLDLNYSTLLQFVNFAGELLGDEELSPVIRSKLLLILSNICLHNITLRKTLANNVQICNSICDCFELAIKQQLGPQNKIDMLRLIQFLTYERTESDVWFKKLVPHIIKEILNSSETKLLPYCLCILCNLVCNSKTFTTNLKLKDFFKNLCIRLPQLLSHDTKAVVISTLVLIGYLDDKTRDIIYSSENLSQTFLCIFNIVNTSNSDVQMTTHIGVDLLKRLIIGQPKTSDECPYLSPTARNLTTYSFFTRSIQKLSLLLNVFDSQSEESRKIVDLLLSFCQIDELKTPVCLAITAIEPSETKLTTPCHALLRIARLPFEETIFPETPLVALRLLIIIIDEAINSGQSLQRIFAPVDSLLLLIYEILDKPKMDAEDDIYSKSPMASFHAAKIAEALRLTAVLSNDEEIRLDLLELVSAQQCAQIYEREITNNMINRAINTFDEEPLTHCQSNIDHSKEPCLRDLPLSSINAIKIPIQLMRLLASFKDYSKPHKELYWRSLKDPRLLPFLAYSIAQGDYELIYDAFVLFTQCTQVLEFPLKKLSYLAWKCTKMRGMKMKDRRHANKCKNMNAVEPTSSTDTSFGIGIPVTNGQNSFQMSLDKKEMQKEFERLQNWQSKNGESNSVNSRLLADLQRRVLESEKKTVALSSEKAELLEKVTQLQKTLEAEQIRHTLELKAIEKEKTLLEEENEKERTLHSILRGKFDELTQKFDTVTKLIFDQQLELNKSVEENKKHAEHVAEIESHLDKKLAELEEAKDKYAQQGQKLREQTNNNLDLGMENKRLSQLKQAMEKLLRDYGQQQGGMD